MGLNGRAGATCCRKQELLAGLYWAAVRAAAPGPAFAAALAREEESRPGRPVWIVAVGKAAHPMAAEALSHLARHGREPAGGVIVAPAPASSPHPALTAAVGDHPVPGPRSLAAAKALGALARRTRAGDEAWVLLSGGATSLAAAPVRDVSSADLFTLYELLLRSGLDIRAMNAIRKRFSRWGAGRLAVALQPALVRSFVLSDVIGDDLAVIGSGPCVPDEATAGEVRALLEGAGLWEQVPPAMRDALGVAERDPSLETPKAGHPAFRRVESRIVASNRLALDAVAARARALGISAQVTGSALDGEAAAAGARVARMLLASRDTSPPGFAQCLVWGGETVVTIASEAPGTGGRCQELALAAARELSSAGESPHCPSLLAAGTDGRDGPTDAAGAIVDGDTWAAVRRGGRDPERDLEAHDSYHALDAAGALFRTGLTGTNVMDVVIGLVGVPEQRRAGMECET